MKYLITILMLAVSTNSLLCQNETTINLNYKEIKEDDVGIFARGNGEFVYQSYMIGKGRVKASIKLADYEISQYAKKLNTVYTKTATTTSKRKNTIRVNFNLTYEDGTKYLLKEEVIKEIKDLKELLDLGVITKEEFDKKANIYKKVFLD